MTGLQAWKQDDGSYRLLFPDRRRAIGPRLMARILELGGGWDEWKTWLIVSAEAVDALGAERVYGVICGPSCCEPARFRWVGAREVAAGRTVVHRCRHCGLRAYRADIVDVCGEPDVARAVYEAEFAASLR